jgi:hypothetical protein
VSHVEQDVEHVAVLDDVALAFGAEQAAVIDGRFGLIETEVVMGARRKTDKVSEAHPRSEPERGEASMCPDLDQLDDEALASLYEEFAEEDRALAAAGLIQYAKTLASVDEEE